VLISFDAEGFAPLEVPAGASLGDVLDGPHSPVFFGCKSGDCGTCLVDVDPEGFARLGVPSAEEQAVLDVFASARPTARLACQLRATCPLRLRFLPA
jgi:ferredoxin